MSIHIGHKKALICKGNRKVAGLFKGDTKIAGENKKTFSGKELSLNTPYIHAPHSIAINGDFIPGVNLFDSEKWLEMLRQNDSPSFPTSTGTDSGYDYIAVSPVNHSTLLFNLDCKENTQYTLSFMGKSSMTAYTGLRIVYTDNTETLIYLKGKSVWENYTATSTPGKTVCGIRIYFYKSDYGYYSNIQLEEGTTATEYTPYIKPTTPVLKWNERDIQIPFTLHQGEKLYFDNWTEPNLTLTSLTEQKNLNDTELFPIFTSLETTYPATSVSVSDGTVDVCVSVSD